MQIGQGPAIHQSGRGAGVARERGIRARGRLRVPAKAQDRVGGDQIRGARGSFILGRSVAQGHKRQRGVGPEVDMASVGIRSRQGEAGS